MAATAPDDIDALRTITQTLEAFGADDQNRILRWASEKLGLTLPVSMSPASSAIPVVSPLSDSTAARPGTTDIKSFVMSKQPKNDTQFAAVVAYFHRFEAADKKTSITKDDLLEACRLANYPRPPKPGQTLQNSVRSGLLDNAARGAFSINSVGENLVAVTLPGGGTSSTPVSPRRKPTKKAASKRPSKKAAAKKAVPKKK